MQENHKTPEEDADDVDGRSPSEVNSLDHYEEGITNEGKKYHRCTYPGCGKVFRFKSEISRHLVIHFPSRPYQCKFKGCKKTFKRNDALENHIRIHAKNLPFACDFPGCDQKFTTKAGLKYHCLKHNNDRPFKCAFPGCNKSFLTASQLKQHQKAFVSHCRISSKQKSEEEKSLTDPSTTELYPPMQKYTHLNEENQFLQQGKVEEGTIPNVEQNFQNMLKYVLKENSVLEKKLEFCDKLITSFAERYAVKSEYDTTQNDPVWKDPNVFFNPSDSVFLDYLREKTAENK